MDLLNTYLAALGGTATALALVKLLSETLLKQFLKKDEIRFEKKLDALAARDETRFNYHFTNSAEAIKEISKKANEVLAIVSKLLYLKSIRLDEQTGEDAESIVAKGQELKEQVNAMAIYTAGVRYLLDESIDKLLLDFYGNVAVAMAFPSCISSEQRFACYDRATAALKRLEADFRKFIEGSKKEKSVPG